VLDALQGKCKYFVNRYMEEQQLERKDRVTTGVELMGGELTEKSGKASEQANKARQQKHFSSMSIVCEPL
jgi:hypothetical protein